jgi:hypothetical protein
LNILSGLILGGLRCPPYNKKRVMLVYFCHGVKKDLIMCTLTTKLGCEGLLGEGGGQLTLSTTNRHKREEINMKQGS